MGWKIKWICVLLFFSRFAFSDEFHLKLTPNTDQKISGLSWDASDDTQEPPVQTRMFTELGRSPYFVLLHGKYAGHESGGLIFEQVGPTSSASEALVTKKLSFQADGSFEVEVEVQGEQTEFSITEVDAAGKTQEEKDKVLFPEWESFKKNPTPSKKLNLYAGLSLGGVTFSQPDGGSGTNNNFGELGVTFRAGVQYQLWKRWSVSGDAAMTTLPIAIGPSGNSIQFLNLNAQVGYTLAFFHSPWKVDLLADYSYRTSFPSQSTFGYYNINGVTLYPRVEKDLPQDKKIWALARFLPLITGGSSFFNSGSYELGIQGGYTLFKVKKHWVELVAGASWFLLQYTGESTGNVQLNSYSAGLNYLF